LGRLGPRVDRAAQRVTDVRREPRHGRLDEGGRALTSALQGAARSVEERERIAPRHALAREAERGEAAVEPRRGRPHTERRVDGEAVVLADQDERERVEDREVDCLVDDALLERRVAEEDDGDARLPTPPEAERDAGGDGYRPPDDRRRARKPAPSSTTCIEPPSPAEHPVARPRSSAKSGRREPPFAR